MCKSNKCSEESKILRPSSQPFKTQSMEDYFECIDFFAGRAMLTKTQQWSGKRAIRFDILYQKENIKGRNVMDITTNEGMGFLGIDFIFFKRVDDCMEVCLKLDMFDFYFW